MQPVAIVIPNWNGSALLANLLGKLRQQTHAIERIIVVDNGSSDDSLVVASSFGAENIELGQHTGFSHDVDFGIRCATGGFRGVYVPDAVAYHQGSATLGPWHPDTVRKISRNQLLLVAKHYPRRWILRYGWPVFVAQGLWGFVALRHGAA